MGQLARLARSLAELEHEVARNHDAFLACGRALLEIRDAGLYRELGCATFADYLRHRWPHIARRTAYNAIAAAGVDADGLDLAPSVLVELARLPSPEQRELAAIAAARTLSVRQLRELIRAREATRRRLLPPRRLPADVGTLADAAVDVGDARNLAELADGSVDHIITSPPYGVGKTERGYVDYADYDGEYRPFMHQAAAELLRVTRDGGRLMLNVPIDNAAHRGVAFDWRNALEAAGWRYRNTAVWHEGNISYSNGRGTIDSPRAINLICPDELVLVFHRGDTWRLPWEGEPDIDHPEWIAWPRASWTFDGESHPYGDYPACFPLELPRRLLKLLTYRGDLVLDPFCGTATTGVACLELGRRFRGFDLNPEAVLLARARLSEVAA